jgi:hypothetical protein
LDELAGGRIGKGGYVNDAAVSEDVMPSIGLGRS